jgi:peptidylprolyl isomerase
VKFRKTRAAAAALAVAAVLAGGALSGCSSSSTATVSGCNTPPAGDSSTSITVSGAFGKAVKIDRVGHAPTSVFQRTVAKAGTGPAVKKNATATIHFAFFDKSGTALEQSDQSFSQGVSIASGQAESKLWNSIACTKTGSRLVLTGPMSDFVPSSSLPTTITANDKVIWVVDVAPTASASVSPAPSAAASDLPSVTDQDGVPTIGDLSGDQPTETRAAVLKAGSGAKVKADSTISVRYVGKQWSNNTVFDSTWKDGDASPSPSPVSFQMSQVITGFQRGLIGQRVGSRVLIVMSADDAYGAPSSDGATTTSGGAPAGALVFVVDITGVS